MASGCLRRLARPLLCHMDMPYRHAIGSTQYAFAGLAEVMAKASPARSGDAPRPCRRQ